MTNSLKVTSESHSSWAYSIPENEKEQIFDIVMTERDRGTCALIAPLRTHDCQLFMKDLFVPTLSRVWESTAYKTAGLVILITYTLLALFLDIMTLPIRLLATPIQIMRNANTESHPLFRWLNEKGAPPEMIASEFIHVKLDWTSDENHHRSQKSWSFYVNKHPSNDIRLEESVYCWQEI